MKYRTLLNIPGYIRLAITAVLWFTPDEISIYSLFTSFAAVLVFGAAILAGDREI